MAAVAVSPRQARARSTSLSSGRSAWGAEFQFITQTGTIYVASDPLGAFLRYAKAPRQLRQVGATKGAIVGVDDRGGAFYFAQEDAGGSWKPSMVPANARLFAVGTDDRGRALAVGAPEALYTSLDGGKTFVASTPMAPHVGATAIGHTARGELAVDGVVGKLVWNEAGSIGKTTEEVTSSSTVGVAVQPSPSPAAGAIREGRGQITGDRYYDLRYPDGTTAGKTSDSPYFLAHGNIAGPLTLSPLKTDDPEMLASCNEVRLAAHDTHVAIACGHAATDGAGSGVMVFSSADGGNAFTEVVDLVTPGFNDVAMAVGGDGSIVVTNVCRPGQERASERKKSKLEREKADKKGEKGPESSGGCHPRGPLIVKLDAPAATKTDASKTKTDDAASKPTPKATFVQGVARELSSTALSPVAASDNRYYFLGRRKKDERPSIFVSTDGGRTYEARGLEAPARDPDPGDEQGSDSPEPPFGNLDFSGDSARLTIDESGTLGLACDSSSGFVWVTADAEGRVIAASSPPEQGASLGGWGRRVVAVGYAQADGLIRAWESSDGGVAFSEITTTPAVANYFGGDTLITCDAGGCLFGDTLARIGWEGQVETPMNLADEAPTTLDTKLRPPIVCELSPRSKWTPVKNLAAPGTSIYPRLTDIGRGASAWALMTRDADSGEVLVTSATAPDRPHDESTISVHSLLGANPGKGRYANTARTQLEGFIAARAPVPEAKGKIEAGKPIDNLEVGWVNFFTNTFGKRTLQSAGAWSTALAVGSPPSVLAPSMLTIAGSSVVFGAGGTQKSLLFDSGNKTTLFDYPDWAKLGVSGPVKPDAALVGGQVFPIALLDRAPTANVFAFAHRPSSASDYRADAMSVGGGASEIDMVYLGAQNGVSTLIADVADDAAESWAHILLPNGTLGERIALPTLRDLGDRPRACTAEDRKATPRTISASFSQRSGTLLFRSGRQPILVTDGPKDPKSLVDPTATWFLSDGAVLYGTPKDPCVAAFRGSSVRRGFAVVVSGDLEHAWMFRPSAGAPGPNEPCNCNPDDPLCQCPEEAEEPTPKSPQKRKRVASSVEVRLMSCKPKADLAIPADVVSMGAIRSADDVP